MANYPYKRPGTQLDDFRETIIEFQIAVEQDLRNTQGQVKKIIAEGDSSPQAAAAAVDIYGEDHGTLKERLDIEQKKTIQSKDEILTNLNKKADITEVRPKNKLLDQEDMTPAFLKKIAGETPINAIPSIFSITQNKLAFNPVLGVPSKNLFNKKTASVGFLINGSTGKLLNSSSEFTSDYIQVTANAKYHLNLNGTVKRIVAFVDEETVISYQDGSKVYETPTNCKFIRFSGKISDLDIAQFELGESFTGYVNYGNKIDPNSIESVDGKSLQNKSVKPNKIESFRHGKNFFNKDEVLTGYYAAATSGKLATNAKYSVSREPIDIEPNTQYTRNYLDQIAFFDENGSYVSGVSYNDPKTFTTPGNARTMLPSIPITQLETFQIELGDTETTFEKFHYTFKYLKADNSEKTNNYERIYSMNDAWAAWMNNEKFPIAFYGDSTFDGVNTTGWVANTLGVDSTSPNTFSKKLEEKLRLETGNNILRIYNAGFSGQKALWASKNMDNEFGPGTAYEDVKMIGLGFGINDRLDYSNVKEYRAGFRKAIIDMIKWCFSKRIQPFLLTTQAAISPGVGEPYETDYPMRTAQHIETVANEVKRDLANEYQLELIDVNLFTEKFLLYSSHSAKAIIADKLHFSNLGHNYEMGLFFAFFNPFTLFVDKYKQIDYMSQSLVKGIPENLLTMPETITDKFKVFANYTKGNTADTLILKTHIFIDTNKKMTLKAYKTDQSSLTYVKVNGVTTTLNTLEKSITQLDLGLHTLEVWTGISNKVDFKGFILE